MNWWQQIIVAAFPALFVLLAVLLGGWLVFRTKTIMMPGPFLPQRQNKKGEEPHSYVSDLYDEPVDDIFDEEMSPAASRLRDQKMDDHEENLKIVRGK